MSRYPFEEKSVRNWLKIAVDTAETFRVYRGISNRFICGIDVVRDAPGIRIAGYVRSESMANRGNRRPSSTRASLCIYYQVDFPVYISARLHALDSEPTGATMRFQRGEQGACSSSRAMHGAHKLPSGDVKRKLFAAIALVPIYS